jgi:ribosomal protein L37E
MLDAIFAISETMWWVIGIGVVLIFWYDSHRGQKQFDEMHRKQDEMLANLTHCRACGNALAQVGAKKCASCGTWQRNT